MLMNPFLLLLSSAAVSLVAFVYCMILTEPGMILNPWFNFIDRHIGWQSGKMNAAGDGLRFGWLYKPLIGCFKCVAGQAALWFYLIKHLRNYDFFQHIFYICFAIFFSLLLKKLYDYTKR